MWVTNAYVQTSIRIMVDDLREMGDPDIKMMLEENIEAREYMILHESKAKYTLWITIIDIQPDLYASKEKGYALQCYFIKNYNPKTMHSYLLNEILESPDYPIMHHIELVGQDFRLLKNSFQDVLTYCDDIVRKMFDKEPNQMSFIGKPIMPVNIQDFPNASFSHWPRRFNKE